MRLLKAIHRFEAVTEFRSFRKFHIEQAKDSAAS